jgi:sulfotransferase family protein
MELVVVGAGVGQTGTHSLKVALEQLLDAPCHHMLERSSVTQPRSRMDRHRPTADRHAARTGRRVLHQPRPRSLQGVGGLREVDQVRQRFDDENAV